MGKYSVVNEAKTMPTIINHLNNPVAPVANNNPAPQVHPSPPPDPSSGALVQFYVESMEKFSCSPIDFEDWELKTRAALGQTAYDANFLTNASVMGDILQEARNKELYNVFVPALMKWMGRQRTF